MHDHDVPETVVATVIYCKSTGTYLDSSQSTSQSRPFRFQKELSIRNVSQSHYKLLSVRLFLVCGNGAGRVLVIQTPRNRLLHQRSHRLRLLRSSRRQGLQGSHETFIVTCILAVLQTGFTDSNQVDRVISHPTSFLQGGQHRQSFIQGSPLGQLRGLLQFGIGFWRQVDLLLELSARGSS